MSSLAFFIKESAFFKKEHAFSCVLKKRMQKNATFFWGLISCQKLKKNAKEQCVQNAKERGAQP